MQYLYFAKKRIGSKKVWGPCTCTRQVCLLPEFFASPLLFCAARAMLGLLPLLTARQRLSRASTCAQAFICLTSVPVQRLALRKLCQQSDAWQDSAHYELINGDRLFPSLPEEDMEARNSAATSVAAPGERCC